MQSLNTKIYYSAFFSTTVPPSEAVIRRFSIRKAFLKISQNSQKNTCSRVSFVIQLKAEAYNFIKKVTLTQMFFCEFWEMFKSTFFTEHLHPKISENWKVKLLIQSNLAFCAEPGLMNTGFPWQMSINFLIDSKYRETRNSRKQKVFYLNLFI